MPAHRSSTQLQRDFLTAFFAALWQRGVSSLEWGSSETDERFRAMHVYLATHAKRGSEAARLAGLIRPDPVSGIVGAVSDSILYLQPGIVSVSNPSYQRIRLVATEGLARSLRRDLPGDVEKLLDGAVEAFLRTRMRTREGSHATNGSVTDPAEAP